MSEDMILSMLSDMRAEVGTLLTTVIALSGTTEGIRQEMIGIHAEDRRRNGRMDRAELLLEQREAEQAERFERVEAKIASQSEFCAAVQVGKRVDAGVVLGRAQVRAEDKARIDAVATFASDYWPLVLGTALSMVGIGSLIWRWLPL